MDFTKTEPSRKFEPDGSVGLQVHDHHMMKVYFREVRVRAIEP